MFNRTSCLLSATSSFPPQTVSHQGKANIQSGQTTTLPGQTPRLPLHDLISSSSSERPILAQDPSAGPSYLISQSFLKGPVETGVLRPEGLGLQRGPDHLSVRERLTQLTRLQEPGVVLESDETNRQRLPIRADNSSNPSGNNGNNAQSRHSNTKTGRDDKRTEPSAAGPQAAKFFAEQPDAQPTLPLSAQAIAQQQQQQQHQHAGEAGNSRPRNRDTAPNNARRSHPRNQRRRGGDYWPPVRPHRRRGTRGGRRRQAQAARRGQAQIEECEEGEVDGDGTNEDTDY